jgi:1,4-alpha-glucan branching enzyme
MQMCVGELNHLYRREAALHELDGDAAGIEWVEANDAEYSVLAFMRKAAGDRDRVLVVCNFTPLVRHNYRVGVDGPELGGAWREIYNSDAGVFGGSGHGNGGRVPVTAIPWHGRRASLNLTLPPLGALYLKAE